jgi:hypothetical protein
MHANQKIKIKNYSTRIPQWKKIDKEIQQLTQQYDQVNLLYHFFIIFNYLSRSIRDLFKHLMIFH